MHTMMSMGSEKEDMDSMKGAISSAADAGAEMEDEGFMSLIQGVNPSPKVLVGLLTALNKVLPLFGIPTVNEKNLTPEVVRGLSMIAQAVSDACEMEECPHDLNFSLDDMKGGDQSILVVSGKLDRIARTPGFRKFLKGKPMEKSPMNSPSQQPPLGDKMAIDKTAEQSQNIDQLFASRM